MQCQSSSHDSLHYCISLLTSGALEFKAPGRKELRLGYGVLAFLSILYFPILQHSSGSMLALMDAARLVAAAYAEPLANLLEMN